MDRLGVTLVKLPFNCCGNPSRGKNFEVGVFSAIKNLALAARHGLDIMTPCKCCFGQLKQGVYWYETQKGLQDKINRILSQEGLSYHGDFHGENRESSRIKHFLSFLYHDMGSDTLKGKMTHALGPGKIALQYGCHALRPFSVTGFDNPYAPKIFKELVNITGLETIDWSRERECCGSPMAEAHGDLAQKILIHKITSAAQEGASVICTACTHCQIHYQGNPAARLLEQHKVSVVTYSHILGLALGISSKRLGQDGQRPLNFLSAET